MTEADIEQVRDFCRQILIAFPGAKITVRDRTTEARTQGERRAA